MLSLGCPGCLTFVKGVNKNFGRIASRDGAGGIRLLVEGVFDCDATVQRVRLKTKMVG